MKYRVGDTVYFENGFKATIQAYDIFSDGNHYFFIGANGMERAEIELIDKHTCSEKEWKEKQQRESFKFKVGDEISVKTISMGVRYYYVNDVNKARNSYLLVNLNSDKLGEFTYMDKKHVEDNFNLTSVSTSTQNKTTVKQYIPCKNEQYFYIDLADENLFGVATFLNDATDIHMLKLGLIKETPQECVKLAKEMLKKLELEV